jgi:hypothetical protein
LPRKIATLLFFHFHSFVSRIRWDFELLSFPHFRILIHIHLSFVSLNTYYVSVWNRIAAISTHYSIYWQSEYFHWSWRSSRDKLSIHFLFRTTSSRSVLCCANANPCCVILFSLKRCKIWRPMIDNQHSDMFCHWKIHIVIMHPLN